MRKPIPTPGGRITETLDRDEMVMRVRDIEYPGYPNEDYVELIGQVLSNDPTRPGWVTMSVKEAHGQRYTETVTDAESLTFIIPRSYRIGEDGKVTTRWYFRKGKDRPGKSDDYISEHVFIELPAKTVSPAKPDCLITNVLRYSKEVQHGFPHVKRWKQVLTALGHDTGEPAISLEEVKSCYKRYSKRRWGPVLERLQSQTETLEETHQDQPLQKGVLDDDAGISDEVARRNLVEIEMREWIRGDNIYANRVLSVEEVQIDDPKGHLILHLVLDLGFRKVQAIRMRVLQLRLFVGDSPDVASARLSAKEKAERFCKAEDLSCRVLQEKDSSDFYIGDVVTRSSQRLGAYLIRHDLAIEYVGQSGEDRLYEQESILNNG